MNHLPLTLFINIYNIVLRSCIKILILTERVWKKLSRWHLSQRCRIPSGELQRAENRSTVWIHCASLGEAKLSIRFISILEKKNPHHVYVVTSVSQSGTDYVRQHKPLSVVAAGYMPCDLVSLMNMMILRFHITRLWLVETELWPSMLWVCLKRNIPVGIVNARMEEKSFSKYRLFKHIVKPLAAQIDCVLSQNEVYSSRFTQLGIEQKNIHVIGNLKSYIVVHQISLDQRNSMRQHMNLGKSDIVIVAACIHPGEAVMIKNTCEALKEKGYDWKWIIVPRHIQKSSVIFDEVGREGVWIKDTTFSSKQNFYIVEAFGVLEKLYAVADAALLGGTFVSVGGHNVWEAVQCGIPVFFGKYYHTQQESYDRVIRDKIGFCVENSKQLSEKLVDTLCSNPKQYRKNLSAFINSTHSSITNVEQFIP